MNIVLDRTPPDIWFDRLLLIREEINKIKFGTDEDFDLVSPPSYVVLTENYLQIDLTDFEEKKNIELLFEDVDHNQIRQLFLIPGKEVKQNLTCDYDNTDNILEVLIDKGNCISEEAIPLENLVEISFNDTIFKINELAHRNFVNLLKDSQDNNLSLVVNSAYRSVADQEALHDKFVRLYGQTLANKIAASPEQSEHHLGTAVDFGSELSMSGQGVPFLDTKEYSWLLKNAWKYGFVLSYPEDAVNKTGYNFEPWHWRFVGMEHAKNLKIINAELTLNQYLYLIQQ